MKGLKMKKIKKLSFTVDMDTYNLWEESAANLIKTKIFRNKTDILESLLLYISKIDKKEVFSLKEKLIS
jgi:hypothetical protein